MELSGHFIKGTGSYEVKELNFGLALPVPAASSQFDTDGTAWWDNYSATKAWNSTTKDMTVTYSNSGSSFGFYKAEIFSAQHQAARIRFRAKSSNIDDRGFYFPDDLNNKIEVLNPNLTTSYQQYEFVGTVSRSNKYLYIRLHATSPDAVPVDADFTIDDICIEEIPPLPGLDKGQQYLERVSGNPAVIGINSPYAYGTWRWKFKVNEDTTGRGRFVFIADKVGAYPDVNGYGVDWRGGDGIRLFKITTDPLFSVLAEVSIGTMSINTWYEVEVTRTNDNEFILYARGGELGNDFIQVTVDIGSNPVTDSTFTTSNYNMPTLGEGDCFIPGPITEGVQQ